MRTITLRKLSRNIRRLKNRLAAQPLILMYHRVADLPSDPQLLAVTPEYFDEQLEIIRKQFQPLRLTQLVEALRAGTLPRRAVILTFDDGYADNLYNALPLLERHAIPATVFVTAGQVGSRHEFWWDELERLLLRAGTLPETLQLQINGQTHEWQLGAAAEYTISDFQRHHDWHIERGDDPGPRQQLYRGVFQLLHSIPLREQQKVLETLEKWSGAAPTGRSTHRSLTADEVITLSQGNLVEVGAHTMTHPTLAALPRKLQRREIEESKVYLEALLGRPVTSFAYPHGSYTAETITIIRAAGFTCACSSDPAAVPPYADPFRLPRLVVRNWSGEMFGRRLKEWLGD